MSETTDDADGRFTETRTVAHKSYETFDNGVKVEASPVDDETLVYVYDGGGETEAVRVGWYETAVLGEFTHSIAVAMTAEEHGVTATVAEGSGADVFSTHLTDRGYLPEVAPPASGRHEATGSKVPVPRRLDRDMDSEEAHRLVAFVRQNPLRYAITFPETAAPDIYIRAGPWYDDVPDAFVRYEDRHAGEDLEPDGFSGVRAASGRGSWDRRRFDEDAIMRRIVREPATRLVHRADAPNALYPEAYHTDCGPDQ